LITEDGSLVYIENFVAIKNYIRSMIADYDGRTKYDNEQYLVNCLMVNKIGNYYAVSFICANDSDIKNRTYILSTKREIDRFRVDFNEVFQENTLIPFILEFSKKKNDNIFVNKELQNYLNKILKEVQESEEKA